MVLPFDKRHRIIFSTGGLARVVRVPPPSGDFFFPSLDKRKGAGVGPRGFCSCELRRCAKFSKTGLGDLLGARHYLLDRHGGAAALLTLIGGFHKGKNC